MKSLLTGFLIIIILFIINCRYWSDQCVNIDDTYKQVIEHCGTGKKTYRAGGIFTIYYIDNARDETMLVMFDTGLGTVNYIKHVEQGQITREEYKE